MKKIRSTPDVVDTIFDEVISACQETIAITGFFAFPVSLILFLRRVPISKKPYQTEQFSGHN